MNQVIASIVKVQISDGIILADLLAGDIELSVLMIDSVNPPSWLKTGNQVVAVFKESEVSLAKNLSGSISLRNRFAGKVTSVNRGKLMSVVTVECKLFTIQSAITSRSVDALNLSPGDEVVALVKANEISLLQK